MFEDDVNLMPAMLKRVYTEVERATQDPEGRIAVDPPRRKELKQIANPLKLGEMHETHFVLGHHWRVHFLRKEAAHKGTMTVANLRLWIDEPLPMGLPRLVENLVILIFAAQTNRSFFLHGSPVMPALDSLSDELELREQRLPVQADWDVAIRRGQNIFGVSSSALLNAANLAKFIDEAQRAAQEAKAPCDEMVEKLRQLLPSLSDKGSEAPRLKTAHAAQSLLNAMLQAREGRLVEAMAGVQLASSEEAVEKSVKKAPIILAALAVVKWYLLEGMRNLSDERRDRAEAIWASVKDAFQKDEYAIALGPALEEAERNAAQLLIEQPKSTPLPPRPPVDTGGEPEPGHTIIAQGASEALTENGLNKVIDEMRHALQSDKGARVRIRWEVFKR